MLADHGFSMMVCGLLICGGVAAAEQEESPEMEFLEYLGMWEETDEDWQILEETMTADNEGRSDPAAEGEESTENEDES